MPKRQHVRSKAGLAGRIAAFSLSFVLGLILSVTPDYAQLGGETNQLLQQQLLQQLQSQQSGTGGGGGAQPSLPSDMLVQPAARASRLPLPQTRLEQIMSARAGAKLEQFGYDQFAARAVAIARAGAVQDDYIMGPGDEIVVSLRGQENNTFPAPVNSDGQVVLPRLNPIPAAGRSFGSFRADVEAAVKRAYVATDAFVSLTRLRQISVLVSGEVDVSGTRIVPGLASVVDALVLSGGVKKTGSLRNVRIQRGGRTITIDLYSVLSDASDGTVRMQLADGDRILVPPLGRTVSVTGLVRRPGIYELPSGATSIRAKALLTLAGGLELRGRYRLSVLRVGDNGNSRMTPLADDNGLIGDSEILFAQLGADQTVSQATLSGDAPLAGQYAISEGTKLSEVLKSPGGLPAAPYTLFGIIARKDPRTLLRTLLAFTPVAVLNGSEDQPLKSDDIIRVLSVNEVRLLTNTVRLYNQRQAAEQAAIRNPLAQPETAPPPAAVQQTPPQGQTLAQLQAQYAAQNQAALDQSANLADIQRRDIAELANQIDPVTRQTLAAQAQAQQQQMAEQQLAYQQANPQLQALGGSLTPPLPALNPSAPVAGDVGSAGQGAGLGTAVPGVGPALGNLDQAPRLPVEPPAANFESVDANSGQIPSNREIRNFADLARQLQVDQLVLVNFLADHQAVLNGAVSGPGSYFVGPNVALQDLVQAAGGTANWADESGVELISTAVDSRSGRAATQRVQLPLRQGTLADYIVHPKDQFRFNQVFNDASLGTATVQGEVRFTGSYQLTRGEHLSELLVRAGGLTGTAYPYGTVFLRKSAADAERAGYIRAAQEIEEELVVAMTRIGNDKVDPATFASLQGFVTELRNQKAVGRIAISADPSLLATRPELDPLLEPGDVVYIPPRPSTVAVLGQVMQPGSLPFRSGSTLRDYIQLAGGYSSTSDPSNTFVVMPDGSARKIEQSWFDFSSEDLPPGATIVVPRDVTPLDTRQLILDITGIFSQLAVSVASLAVLSKQ
ncbi:MAG TPA: SLBB domain-containing protein [Rhizomicrobium sp.]|nr:SLBB domain-containing protein [Rhizomicrobium sp.]